MKRILSAAFGFVALAAATLLSIGDAVGQGAVNGPLLPGSGISVQCTDYNGAVVSPAVQPCIPASGHRSTIGLANVSNFRNVLDNGKHDFYQRGTTALTGINTTATYHSDRWACYSNAGGASVTLTNIIAGLPVGFANAEQVQRAAANANTTAIFCAQEIPSADVIALQGQSVCVSTSLIAGANFSGGTITEQVITGTGSDQGLASLIAATWTGQATTLNTTVTPTTSWARYTPSSACFTMPATATEAAVQFGFTPVGTAGANDWFQFTGAQVEGLSVPLVSAAASAFEHRSKPVELQKLQSYAFLLSDGAATRRFGCMGLAISTTVAQFGCALPVQMRAIPTTTVSLAASFAATTGAGAANNCTTMAAIATSNTVNSIGLSCTGAASLTQGQASELIGQATAGTILVSADF